MSVSVVIDKKANTVTIVLPYQPDEPLSATGKMRACANSSGFQTVQSNDGMLKANVYVGRSTH